MHDTLFWSLGLDSCMILSDHWDWIHSMILSDWIRIGSPTRLSSLELDWNPDSDDWIGITILSSLDWIGIMILSGDVEKKLNLITCM